MTFNSKLIALLKTDSRLVDDEGELVIAAVQDRAWKIDRDLVKLLLSDKEMEAKFFDEIEGHWIFDTNTFIDYISQKNFLDNSYTRFRNRIGLTVGNEYLRERGDVALVWAYKDAFLEGGQTKEEEKRKEIFFNEVLAQDEINRLLDPKVLTNFARYTTKGKQAVKEFKRRDDGVLRENLIVKGNNLLALHMLKTQFHSQVKLIYIDPPYNTGTDSFGYNNSFNHSTWLTFMKNRLEIARELLSQDGSIWVNIGDEEAHYLKVLCDDVFDRENFVRNVLWQKRTSPDTRATLGDAHDHILVFAKKLEVFKEIANRLPKSEAQSASFKNPDTDPRGSWVSSDFTAQGFRPNQMYRIVTPGGKEYYPPEGRCWKNIESVYLKLVKEGRMWFGQDGQGVPRRKTYLNEVKDIAAWSWWTKDEVGHNQEAKKESIALFGADGAFSTPKPERLLKRIIQIGSDAGEIVLDFFAGSGTSVAVAHKMGRQYIGVEQLEYSKDYVVERLKKVIGKETHKKGKLFAELDFDDGGISKSVNWKGGGDFVCCELMQYNETFMEHIQAAKTTKALMAIWRKMAEGSFLNWYVNPIVPKEAIKEFEKLGKESNGMKRQKHLLASLLDKNQLYVNLSEIDDAQFKVSKEEKALNLAFYGEAYNA